MINSEEFKPWESELDDLSLDAVTLDKIKSAADVTSSSAEKEFDYDIERQRAKIKKLRNDNKKRKRFFSWASKLTFTIIWINSVLFAAYLAVHMWGEHPIPDLVMVSWVTSTIIEVLGIVTIIARYLFPGKSKRPQLVKIVSDSDSDT